MDLTNKDSFKIIELSFANNQKLYCIKNILIAKSNVFKNVLCEENFRDDKLNMDEDIELFKIILEIFITNKYDILLYPLNLTQIIDIVNIADKYEFIDILKACKKRNFDSYAMEDLITALSNVNNIKVDIVEHIFSSINKSITKDNIVDTLNKLQTLINPSIYNINDRKILLNTPNLKLLHYKCFQCIGNWSDTIAVCHQWIQNNPEQHDKIPDIIYLTADDALQCAIYNLTYDDLEKMHDLVEYITDIKTKIILLDTIAYAWESKHNPKRRKLTTFKA